MTQTTHLPLITVPRDIRSGEVLVHTQALVNAGFDAIEISFNSLNLTQSVQLAARAFGDRAPIGAGTVLRLEDIDLMVTTGGKLVVTPNTHALVICAIAQTGLIACIGCMIAIEVFAALNADVQALKTFPAGALGPGYVRALKAVLSTEAPVLAAGGITPESPADYLAAGCIDTGLGSDLYRPGQPVGHTVEHAYAFVTAYRNAQSDRT